MFRENQCSDSITFLTGINELVSVLVIFFDRFERNLKYNFRVMPSAQQLRIL